MKIGTLTTGDTVVTSIPLTYVPQYIYYVAATALKGLKVNVLGDGTICDLDEDGLKTIGIAFIQSRVTNLYMIPLANGLIKGKNVTITITNSAAQTPDIYASSLGLGSMYVVSQADTALAKSGARITKFLSAHFPSAASTDFFNIEYKDGTVENNLDRLELQNYNELTQYVSNTASDYYLKNDKQRVKTLTITPTSTQVFYTTAFAAPGSKFLNNK